MMMRSLVLPVVDAFLTVMTLVVIKKHLTELTADLALLVRRSIYGRRTVEEGKKAKSVEELIAIASLEGIELTEEKASKVFEQLKIIELGDDELDDVAGGALDGRRRPSIEAFC